MKDASEDAGVMVALVERFTEQRLPRAVALKERVDNGESLTENDIKFLEEVFRDANQIMPLVDRHPEWQPLAARAIHLYKEITDRALENEKKS